MPSSPGKQKDIFYLRDLCVSAVNLFFILLVLILYQGVIGIDRTFFTNLYVNVQFFVDIIDDGREEIALKQKTHGLTFEISDKVLDDDLTAGFRGMYFTSHEGSAYEIFAEYKIGDNWQIAPCYMFFNGPKDSRLGQFSHNDMIYFRLRYSF